MTKKDYELIADCINAQWLTPEIRQLALYMASELKRDNPRFDRAKFLKACGIQE